MKLILRLLADAAIVVVAWLAIDHFCIRPYGWYAQHHDVYADLERADEEERNDGNRSVARELLERLDTGGPWGTNASYHVARAEALRILGRNDEAIATYQTALSLQRRPEIYTPLGLLQIKAGRREEGIQSLITAIRFNGAYGGWIDRTDVANEIVARLDLK